MLIVGHVAVDQLVQEPPRTPLPGQVQILDQKRRDDHPDPVVQVSGPAQLAHARIDYRKPGLAGFPRLEQPLGVLSAVGFDGVEIAVPVPPRAVRPMVQDRRIEVTKSQLAQVSTRTAAT
ncbi:hypothetical protein AWC14_14315 [Mycobacterium kyorinense]|uniref:Uncharacterized protein n=1 Tax=Mycobacterium kyorinense TaxID=487514 RepID=A0A1X1XGF1_9MYCO|nr:hypothetical protein AWC14_14315 [Mycobacterium kyorinense]